MPKLIDLSVISIVDEITDMLERGCEVMVVTRISAQIFSFEK